MSVAVKKKPIIKRRRDVVFPIVNGILLTLLMLITLYPILNTVAISFNDGTDAVRGGIGIWPRMFSTEAYRSLLTDEQIYSAFFIFIFFCLIFCIF